MESHAHANAKPHPTPTGTGNGNTAANADAKRSTADLELPASALHGSSSDTVPTAKPLGETTTAGIPGPYAPPYSPPIVSGEHDDLVFNLTASYSASESGFHLVPLDLADMRSAKFLEFEAERFTRRYKLIEAVGTGTFGQVYRAHDRYLQRDVALKRLNLASFHGASDHALRLFRYSLILEARIGAQLVHPNLVPIHAFGLDAENNPYLVMRFLHAGKTLRKILKTRATGQPAMSRDDLLRVIIRACDGLAYAHMRGVVHRDVKPDNIYVADFDDVTVLDWGVARVLNDSVVDIMTLSIGVSDRNAKAAGNGHSQAAAKAPSGPDQKSMFRGSVGTVPYMAPEQVDRNLDGIGPRTDIWAMGIILYELLTGRRPFADKNPFRLQVAISRGDYEPPKAAVERLLQDAPPDAAWLPDRVPAQLDRIVGRCLAHDPENRYASISDLKADLEAFLNHRPLEDATTAEVVGKWLWRNVAMVWGVTAAIFVALLAGAGAMLAYLDAIERETARAKMAESLATTSAHKAEHDRARAEARIADGLLGQARALGSAGEWADAKAKFIEAELAWNALGRDPAPVMMGVWDAHRHAPPPLHTIVGLGGTPTALAVTADSRHALCADSNGRITMWDLHAALKRHTLVVAGTTARITALTVAADDSRLVAGTATGEILVWPFAPPGESDFIPSTAHTFAGHTGRIAALALAGDGITLLSADADGTARVWNLATGEAVSLPDAHGAGAGKIFADAAISADGRQLALATIDREIRLWRRESSGFVGPVSLAVEARPAGLSFSADGRQLAIAHGSRIDVCDVDGTRQRTILPAMGRIDRVRFSPDGRTLVATARQGLVVWDVSAGRLVRSMAVAPRDLAVAAISPDARFVIGGNPEAHLKVWATAQRGPSMPLRGHSDAVTAVAFSPDRRLLASASVDGTVRLWDVATGREWLNFAVDIVPEHLAFSADGRTLRAAGARALAEGVEGGSVWQFSLTDATAAKLPGFGDSRVTVPRGAFAPDGRHIFTADDSTGHLRDLATGTIARTFAATGRRILAVDFTPDMGRVLTLDAGGAAKLWAGDSGEMIAEFAGAGQSLAGAFTPDGRFALVPGERFALEIRAADRGAIVGSLAGHRSPVIAVAVSASAMRALSVEQDGRAMLWDLRRAREIHTFELAPVGILAMAVSADARCVAMAGHAGALAVWNFDYLAEFAEKQRAFFAARVTLATQPESAGAWLAVGEWLSFHGAWSLANDCYAIARQSIPDADGLHLAAARAAWMAGDRHMAADFFSRAKGAHDAPPDYIDGCLRAIAAE